MSYPLSHFHFESVKDTKLFDDDIILYLLLFFLFVFNVAGYPRTAFLASEACDKNIIR